jgi:cytochrome oxidase Cu insertion factor (SCO1/SenC/PrrC family)
MLCVCCALISACGETNAPGGIAITKTSADANLPDCCKKTPGRAQLIAAAVNDALKEDLIKSDHPTSPDSMLEPWPVAGERDELLLKTLATDQDGNEMKIGDLKGKPIVATFIFTRCANPEMCPAIVSKMAALQRMMEKEDLTDQVNLALISYDPGFDTPDRLRSYGAVRGIKFTNAKMLRPNPDGFSDMITEFELRVSFGNNSSITNHTMDLYVLDSNGAYVRQYQGIWHNEMVLSDVRRLLTEQPKQVAVSKN